MGEKHTGVDVARFGEAEMEARHCEGFAALALVGYMPHLIVYAGDGLADDFVQAVDRVAVCLNSCIGIDTKALAGLSVAAMRANNEESSALVAELQDQRNEARRVLEGFVVAVRSAAEAGDVGKVLEAVKAAEKARGAVAAAGMKTDRDGAGHHTLERTSIGSFVFESGGVAIHDPLSSECGRFRGSSESDGFSPANYGFKVCESAGGGTAWERLFLLDGAPVVLSITNVGGDTHKVNCGEPIRLTVRDTSGRPIASWLQDEGTLEDCPPRVVMNGHG